MIDATQFYGSLLSQGLDFFTGVPDSLLQSFCACVQERCPKERHILAANEGNAVAIASGLHIASGKIAVVYMQNSGLGNAVNPLLSLADADVYRIPMLFLIGWRGEPGIKDEPQHVTQGRLTLPLLETLGIRTLLLTEDYEEQLNELCGYMRQTGKPAALLVRKDSFAPYPAPKTPKRFSFTREEALCCVLEHLESRAFLVSTTGKTSRELFELREKRGEGHAQDFLTVGSMGHTASIALGMATGTKAAVYCLDGDGSFIMHMGSLGIAAQHAPPNFRYILINNGAHESVGGQPTACFAMDAAGILRAAGFTQVQTIHSLAKIPQGMRMLQNHPHCALVIEVDQGSRKDLGRPTIAPEENKKEMMRLFTEENDNGA